jgi:hypothetical protein
MSASAFVTHSPLSSPEASAYKGSDTVKSYEHPHRNAKQDRR